jgi:16S rRNA G1207 methylase RsmC
MGNDIGGKFLAEHSDELVDGRLKVCIGGGAGFIGSHIAKRLRQEVFHYFMF